MIVSNEPTELESFYLTYHPMSDRSALRNAIQDHIRYNTLTVIRDDDGIAGFLRFNVIGECIHVLDLMIRRGLERKGLIKFLAMKTWHKYPYLKYFRFEREGKYEGRTPRAYSIAKFLKGKR